MIFVKSSYDIRNGTFSLDVSAIKTFILSTNQHRISPSYFPPEHFMKYCSYYTKTLPGLEVSHLMFEGEVN